MCIALEGCTYLVRAQWADESAQGTVTAKSSIRVRCAPSASPAAGGAGCLHRTPIRGALGCRRLWRLGDRCVAWVAGIGLGAMTIAASLVAGLLGPVAIAIYAIVLSLPVWLTW